jgi:hypothetical protein
MAAALAGLNDRNLMLVNNLLVAERFSTRIPGFAADHLSRMPATFRNLTEITKNEIVNEHSCSDE